MRKAVTTIACYQRRHMAKKLLEERRWGAQVIRRFIKGFICRHMEENEVNKYFILLVRREYLRRLAKSLPQSVLDKSWPTCPPPCKQTSELLQPMHSTWLVRKYVKTLSLERKFQLQQKVLAEELFKNKKQSYQVSVPRPFETNRLNPEQDQMKKTVFETSIKSQDEKVIYCVQVVKYDRHGYKARTRILILTNKAVYLLDDKDFKLKHRLDLKDIMGLCVSNLTDGMLILGIPRELKKDKGDLILDFGENLIEAVMKIIMVSGNKTLLQVEQSGCISHYMTNGKEGIIEFSCGSEPLISKGKNGHLTVISVLP